MKNIITLSWFVLSLWVYDYSMAVERVANFKHITITFILGHKLFLERNNKKNIFEDFSETSI